MSEMVERVAKALCEEKLWLGAFDKEPPSNQEAWLSAARAAIEAMREPSQAMLDYRPAFQTVHDARLIWGHQIDEALKD